MVTWDVLASHEAMRAWHATRLSAHATDLAGLRAARARLHLTLLPDPNPNPATQPGSNAAAHEAADGGECAGLSAGDRLEADCAVQVRVDGAAIKLHDERLRAMPEVAAASMRTAGPGLHSVDQAKLGQQARGSSASRMFQTRPHPDRQPARATQAGVSTLTATATGAWQQGLLAPRGAAAAGDEAIVHGSAGSFITGAPADNSEHKNVLHELQVRREHFCYDTPWD